MQFEYTARDESGNAYTQEVEAPDKFAVYEQVRAKGHEIQSVSEKTGAWWESLDFQSLNAKFSTVKTQDKIVFARTLAAMLEAGLSAARAYRVLVRQTKNPKLKSILQRVQNELEGGKRMHSALESIGGGVFSDLFIAMVKSGEESGTLAPSLRAAAKQLERANQLAKRIRGAMIYPAIVITAMIGIGVLMLIYVVPTLQKTFESLGVDLPVSTRIILGVSDFLTNQAILSAAIAVAVVGLAVVFFRTETGNRAFAWTLLRLPVIGVMAAEVNAARTARTFSSLLASGVDVVRALEITGEVVQNPYFREALDDVQRRVQKGETLADIFEEYDDLYPSLFIEMVAVGEETGAVSDMLEQVADYYESEVERGTKNLSTVVEPILMLVIGAVVGFFAISMITPIYSISSGI